VKQELSNSQTNLFNYTKERVYNMAKATSKTNKATKVNSTKARATKATKAKAAPKTAPKADVDSKMQTARNIVQAAFANAGPEGTPRKDAIVTMMSPVKDGGLGMQKTTASTYFAHCIKFFREQEQAQALAKAEAGKPVYSAYKTKKGIVTSAGVFLTRKAAAAFNSEFRHDGVVKGVQPLNQPVMAQPKRTKAA